MFKWDRKEEENANILFLEAMLIVWGDEKNRFEDYDKKHKRKKDKQYPIN